MVACLDAETGKPQWTRRVASALAGVAEAQNFVSHLLLTLGENTVFFVPEIGVVTALDARDGRLLWAVTYPAYLPKESPILEEPRKQGLTPAVFHQGVLYAAPTDSESLLAISAKTGVILWEREIPEHQDQIRHVLGVVKNRLVLSGKNLWILNATTGAVESPAALPPGSDSEFDGYGAGADSSNQFLLIP
jgi:outer membrane protein assembly factor BamB